MITPQDMYTINIQSRTFKERSLHEKTNYNKWISIEKSLLTTISIVCF